MRTLKARNSLTIFALLIFAASSSSAQKTCVGDYMISQIGGSLTGGGVDIGNHGDDLVTTIALPFSYRLYDQTFNSVNLSSNGNAQFVTTDATFTNVCPLPWTGHNYTISPNWDDLYLVNPGFGIFTQTIGSAPNRTFIIQWRAQYFPGSGNANFELRLYEGQSRFDVIYGTVTNGTSSTAGVQKDNSTFVQYFCNGSGAPVTGGQSYIRREVAGVDVDGNGVVDPLTDGILILRYAFHFHGGTLIAGAVDTQQCHRCTALEIETYLACLFS